MTQTASLASGVADAPTATGPRRRLPYRRLLFALAVVALLAQMAVAMVTTAVQQTPTIDEPVYVGTATVYLKERSLRYNAEHPPLGKLIIATGVAVAARTSNVTSPATRAGSAAICCTSPATTRGG